MIQGERLLLRPVQDTDWPQIETWGRHRDGLWGAYQRSQPDHLPLLRQVYQKTGMLSRESSMFLIETLKGGEVIGFVRYSMIPFPDGDLPHPEVGFGIPEVNARGKGHAQEALRLLVEYIFSNFPSERITAFTDAENIPAQQVMENTNFQREGVLRRSMFRDGKWRDIAIYGILRPASPE